MVFSKETSYIIRLSTVCLISAIMIGCSGKVSEENLHQQLHGLPSIEGSAQYLASPFVTAGDRIYMIGHQDGKFPDLGWHIEGEMGGIWDHPVKLMDGFSAAITLRDGKQIFCIDSAVKFINYPVANLHQFSWKEENLTVERLQFIPDSVEGVVIEFSILNSAPEEKEIVFSFTGLTDLRPTWLSERTGMTDGEDSIFFDKQLNAFIAKDRNNHWYTAFGSPGMAMSSSAGITACEPPERKGSGKTATISFALSLKPDERRFIPVFIAGSYQSEEALRNNYNALKKSKSLFARKIERYKMIDLSAHLTIPDKKIEKMYKWLKYNTDWLVRHVPEQGRGIGAGLPDYPWWFGADMCYSLQGILATGDHKLAKNSIVLLQNISQKLNGNGRIVHETSTNGAVYNAGNVNETAQFIALLKLYYGWTGDSQLIKELFPEVKKGIQWLLMDMDPDGNGYPNGSGMMEIRGLDKEMIDVAVYTQQALEAAAHLARAVGDSAAANNYQETARDMKIRINKEWWNSPQKSYGDFRGTVSEARHVLQSAVIRADTLKKPWAVAELKSTEEQLKQYPDHQEIPHVVYHNWVVNTPMETGIADLDKGRQALETASRYENPFGVFVTGIDRTEEPDSVVLQSRKKTFSYTGAVMTLPTGVQAVAAAKYGTPEDALRYIEKLERSFSYALPGSMYEVSPDFGMVTQAWNIYGVAVPIVNHFFGIRPEAYAQTVYISPCMPLSWADASLENVKIGDNSLNIRVKQMKDHITYHIFQTKPDWRLVIDTKKAKKVILNEQEQDLGKIPDSISTTGGEIKILIFPN